MQSMYTVPAYRSVPQPIKAQPTRWLFLIGVLMVLLIAATLMAAGLGALILYTSGRVLPGISSVGMSLSGMSLNEATARLSNWNTVTLNDGRHTWTIPADQLGLHLDSHATALAAQTIGRGSGSLVTLMSGKTSVMPVISIDLAQAQKELKALVASDMQPAVNATVHLINGTLTPVAAIEGFQIDAAATLARLQVNAAGELANGTLILSTTKTEPSVTDASSLVDKARRLLASPLTINAYNPITDKTTVWTLPSAQWGNWLSVENTASGLGFSLNTQPLQNYLTGQNLTLGNGQRIDTSQSQAALQAALSAGSTSATVRVYNSPTDYAVQSGDTLGSLAWKIGIPMWRITKANPGVNLDTLSVGQRITLPSKDDMLPVPIIYGKRIVISITKQHMWVYENGQIKWDWVASTGISDSPTMPGVFQVQSHDKNAYGGNWNLWMPNFLGIYEAVPGFMNGIHGLPTLASGRLLWAGFLGRPITYGCILLSLENAASLYNWASDGVIVEIQP